VRNYTGKHVPENTFARMMVELKGAARPMSLDEWLALASAPDEPCFTITFDDGFENNHSIAAPVLADLGIPATFYVATGLVEHNAMSWIDRVELAFENARTGRVRLPGEARERQFFNSSEAITILNEVRRSVKSNPAIDPEDIARDLTAQLGQPCVNSGNGPLDQKMNWEQVRELHRHPLFTIGGHSHSHPVLSHLPDERLREEIQTSIHLLKTKGGMEQVRHYSYPEGLAHHFDDRVIRELKAVGVTCCPTAIEGVNAPDTDAFLLKRILIG
jgi:peptidoglycan/xylan/chitin deacetylase (PgdA/CDA1 family)